MYLLQLLDYKIYNVRVLYICILLLLLSVALITPSFGIQIWAVIFITVVAFGIIMIIFNNYRYGLIIILAYAYFLFLIERLIGVNVTIGVPLEILTGITLVAVLIRIYSGKEIKENPYSSPIGVFLIIWFLYDIIQLFNPNTYDASWALNPMRTTLLFLIGFFIAYKTFSSMKYIKIFILAWLIFSLIGALYGLKQEYFGLTSSEWEWLTADPKRFSLLYQWGRIRKWSFFSDVVAFSVTMSFTAIACFILMLGPFRTKYRIAIGIAGFIMVLAMTYSGTRSATAMIPIGLAFYFFMNINNRITLAIAIITFIGFLGLYYGPFYGPTFSRLRSAFNTDDPSLNFREYKREKLQQYIYEHPVGGGLGTANETAGRLSETYDPDNGYLRTALDKGIPGLIIQLSFFATILIIAINGYFKVKNKKLKFIYSAFIAAFYSITIAQFFQDAVYKKPVNLVIISYLAIIIRLRQFDE